MRRGRPSGAAALAGVVLLAGCVAVTHRSALGVVVRGCVLDSRVTGSPWPCLTVDRARAYVVLPDPKRRTQVLLAPVAPVVGIEDAHLLAGPAPNAWARAWAARSWLDRRAGRPLAASDVGLAVNSRPGRTQDQLHIHIDCLRPTVRRAVDAALEGVDETWRPFPTPLYRGHLYRARWLPARDLATTDPFRLLAQDPAVGGDLADWTLAMVAAVRPDGEQGFVLLSHRSDLPERDLGASEELLDHRCAVLADRPAPDGQGLAPRAAERMSSPSGDDARSGARHDP